jgi:hypothetical protein
MLTATLALRVYNVSGREEEHFAESFELGYSLTIRETAAGRTRSRQRCKLQTMLIGSPDDIDGLIPDAVDHLYLSALKGRFRFDLRRDL